jgi:hypothetical protein
MGLGNTLDEAEAPGTMVCHHPVTPLLDVCKASREMMLTCHQTRRDFFDLLKTPQELAEEQQAEKAQKAKEGDKGKDEQKPAQDNKKTTESPLKEIFSQSGLGGLVGNAHHGVGILPVS